MACGVINGPGQRSLLRKWSDKVVRLAPGCSAGQVAPLLSFAPPRFLLGTVCSTVSIRRQAVPLAARTSLARASGPCTAALVSLLIACGHFCFAYAQLTGQSQDCPGYNGTGCPQSFAGSDGLAKIIMYADVEYEARGWVASALGLAEEGVCHTSCPHGNQTSIPAGEGAVESVCGLLSCDTCVALFGVGAEQACVVNLHQYLLHMSYLYSVDHLWGQARPSRCIHAPPDHPPTTPPPPTHHAHQDESVTCQLGTEPSCTGIYPARLAAACLVVFSFIW